MTPDSHSNQSNIRPIWPVLRIKVISILIVLLFQTMPVILYARARQTPSRQAAEAALAAAEKAKAKMTPEALHQALAKYETALEAFRALNDKKLTATTLNAMGEVYYYLSQPKRALEYFTPAADLFHQLNDPLDEAGVLINIGTITSGLGDKQQALDLYERALKLLHPLNAAQELAILYNNLAVLYGDFGERQKAVENLQAALPILQKLDDKPTIAAVLHNLGGNYMGLGNAPEALNYFKQALVAFRAVNDKRGEASSLTGIGSVYGSLGEREKQLQYYLEALPLAEAIGDKKQQAIILSSAGSATFKQDIKVAKAYFERALIISKAIGDRMQEAHTLHNLASSLIVLNDRAGALEKFQESLALSVQVGDQHNQAMVLDALGSVHKNTDAQTAFDYYQRALDIRQRIGDRKNAAGTLCNLARLERARGNLLEASRYIDQALELQSTDRAQFNTEELRTAYTASTHNLYEVKIDLLMQLHQRQPASGFDREAFELSEGARALSLIELLTEAHTEITAGIDEDLRARKNALLQKLRAKGEAQIHLSRDKTGEAQRAVLEKQVSNLATEYQELLSEIRTRNPAYSQLAQPRFLSLSEIQGKVLETDTLLLEFMLGEPRSYLFAVTRDSLTSYELPGRQLIEVLVRRFTEAINAFQEQPSDTHITRQARKEKARAELAATAKELSRILLTPVAARLGEQRLFIVADGALHYLPFAALPEPSKNNQVTSPHEVTRHNPNRALGSVTVPLILKHDLVCLPSAATLAVIRDETKDRPLAQKSLAVFADPVFDEQDSRLQKASAGAKQASDTSFKVDRAIRAARESRNLARLFFSREEADAIYEMAKGGGAIKRLDFKANLPAALDAELANYRIVHFSTHGILNGAQPELSGVVLSLFDERGHRREGFLGLAEVFNLRLPVELVTVSACQSALGKEISGEGIVGLTRGFMYAGARRVMASLWNIQDRATAKLMQQFYANHLRLGMPMARALREAQIKMLQTPAYASPFYWAGFVLQGEW